MHGLRQRSITSRPCWIEEDAELRRRAATSLRRLMKHRNAGAWDLLGWALADEDNGVRRAAPKALGSLVNSAPALAAQFAERSILDADEAVRSGALRCLERLDRSSERVRAVILRNAGHTSIDIRRSCIQMLPSFIGEVELRSTAMELLRTEPDPGLQEMLRTFLVDRASKARRMRRMPSSPRRNRFPIVMWRSNPPVRQRQRIGRPVRSVTIKPSCRVAQHRRCTS